MATSIPKLVVHPAIMRGDVWPGMTVTFNKSGHDFTGTTARVQLRKMPDSTMLTELVASVTYPALGQMTVTISCEGSVTRLFPPGTILGDVELSRTSPAFGPRTWYRFQFDVIGDVSHA